MTTETVAPVRKEITVQAPQQTAFEVFTARMASWWNPAHHIADEPFVDLVVEPRKGGRWFERDADGVERDWGGVLVWEPPERLVLGWQLDASYEFRPDFVTEVEIRFVVEGPGTTRVELEHRDLERFGDDVGPMRASLDSPNGWSGLLELLAGALRSGR
jgi:hypothetical protein